MQTSERVRPSRRDMEIHRPVLRKPRNEVCDVHFDGDGAGVARHASQSLGRYVVDEGIRGSSADSDRRDTHTSTHLAFDDPPELAVRPHDAEPDQTLAEVACHAVSEHHWHAFRKTRERFPSAAHVHLATRSVNRDDDCTRDDRVPAAREPTNGNDEIDRLPRLGANYAIHPPEGAVFGDHIVAHLHVARLVRAGPLTMRDLVVEKGHCPYGRAPSW